MVSKSPARPSFNFGSFFQEKKRSAGFASPINSTTIPVKPKGSFADSFRKITQSVPTANNEIVNDQLKEVNNNLRDVSANITKIYTVLIKDQKNKSKQYKKQQKDARILQEKKKSSASEKLLEGGGLLKKALKAPFQAVNNALGNPFEKIKNALFLLGIGWLTDKFVKYFKAEREGDFDKLEELKGEITAGLAVMGSSLALASGGLGAIIFGLGVFGKKLAKWLVWKPFKWLVLKPLQAIGRRILQRFGVLRRPVTPPGPGGNLPASRNPRGLNRGVTQSGQFRNPLRTKPNVTQGRGGNTFRQRFQRFGQGFTRTGRGVSTGTPGVGRSGGPGMGGGAGYAMLALMTAELLEPVVLDQIAIAKFSNLSDLEVLQKIENLTIQLDRTAKEDEKRQAELKAAGGYYDPVNKRYYKNYGEYLTKGLFGAFLPDDEELKTKNRLTNLNALFQVGQTKGLLKKVTVNNEDTFQLTEKGGNVETPAPKSAQQQLLELSEAHKEVRSTPSGAGKNVRFPGVGTVVAGRNMFGFPEDKYFDVSGNPITKNDFHGIYRSRRRRLQKEAEEEKRNQEQTQQPVEPTTPISPPRGGGDADDNTSSPADIARRQQVPVTPTTPVMPAHGDTPTIPYDQENLDMYTQDQLDAMTPSVFPDSAYAGLDGSLDGRETSNTRNVALNAEYEGQQVTVDVSTMQIPQPIQPPTPSGGSTVPNLKTYDTSNPYRMLSRSIYNVLF